MKIAHLTSVHPRNDIRICLKQCASLSKNGATVTLVVADGLGSNDATVASNGIRFVDVGKSKSRIRRMLFATKRIGRAAVQVDADIYHFHDPELIPVGLRLKSLGKKVIFDAHEDVAKQLLNKPYLNAPLRRLLSVCYARYEVRRARQMDAIVAATPFIRDKYRAMNDIVVDINNYPLINELVSEIPWVSKDAAVCYVGGISRIRGVIEVINAMSHVSSAARLHMVGKFSDSESAARGLPGWDRVRPYGQVDRVGVRDVLSKSIAGLVTFHPLPNHIDAQPNKMFEYMSAGIPVIASHFPLWREIIEGNNCGICVDPMDPKAIASAIDRLVGDPDMARRMGENGRRAVIEKYNWSIEEKKLLALYESLRCA